MRISRFTFIPVIPFLFGSSLLAACATDAPNPDTTPADDELAGDVNDGAKSDGSALQSTFGIYTAQKIGAFECNHGASHCTHIDLALAGRSTTTCVDGSKAAACSVQALDFSALALTPGQVDAAVASLQASAATPELGAQLLVRGTFVAAGDSVTFRVSELWQAQLAGESTDGTFVMLRDNGIRCITAPCPSLNENRLSSVRNLNIDGIDWPEDASQELRGSVYEATTRPDGVIVAGDRTHGTVHGKVTTLRRVRQAFLRVD